MESISLEVQLVRVETKKSLQRAENSESNLLKDPFPLAYSKIRRRLETQSTEFYGQRALHCKVQKLRITAVTGLCKSSIRQSNYSIYRKSIYLSFT